MSDSTDRLYLVRYGHEGYIAVARGSSRGHFSRGQRVLARTHRGQEWVTILRPMASDEAARFPDGVRVFLEEDGGASESPEAVPERLREEAFAQARHLAQQLGLPIEVVDVEVIVQPRTLVVHYLRTGSGPIRALIAPLGQRFTAFVEMYDIVLGVANEFGDGHNDRRCSTDTTTQSGGCQGRATQPGGCPVCGRGATDHAASADGRKRITLFVG